MALQTSPPISLNDIKSEFGASGARSLTEFYRGGAFVPNVPANSGVPTSGAISLLDFLGATAYVPIDGDRNSLNQTDFRNEPAPPTSQVTATGNAGATGGTGSYSYLWSIQSGGASISTTPTLENVAVTADVIKGGAVSGTIRCRISDGVTSINIDRSYRLSYITDV